MSAIPKTARVRKTFIDIENRVRAAKAAGLTPERIWQTISETRKTFVADPRVRASTWAEDLEMMERVFGKDRMAFVWKTRNR